MNCQIDVVPNALETIEENRYGRVRESHADAYIHLELHTLSAVNSTENSPYLRDACDAQFSGYIVAAARLNAERIDVHAGYHFTDDKNFAWKPTIFGFALNPDRDMWVDAARDQPAEHLARAIGGIAGGAIGFEAESLFGALDHGLGGSGLLGDTRRCRLDIEDGGCSRT